MKILATLFVFATALFDTPQDITCEGTTKNEGPFTGLILVPFEHLENLQ